MNFSSSAFLFLFLPVVLVAFYVVPRQLRLVVLLLGSLFFYGMSGDMAVSLLMVAVVWAAIMAFALQRSKNLALLWLVILMPLGVLFLFKYLGFALSIVDPDGSSRDTFSFILRYSLPAGISFYTFQIVSYLLDIHDGKVAPDRNPLILATFACYFPQLIAGPILRYHELRDQLVYVSTAPRLRPALREGIKFLSVGLVYKIFFADILRSFQEAHRVADGGGALDALFAVFAYSFIIYFDFWSYSLMAIGLAKLFSINLPRNFREPYLSATPRDFWRRWHVTLSYWLRDYVYIRLGGNRNYVRNIVIVFLAVGLWHGAGWNFLVWGAYHAVLVILYHWSRPVWDGRPLALQVGVTFVLVSLGWPLFYLDISGYGEIMATIFTLEAPAAALRFGLGHWAYLAAIAAWVFLTREDSWLFNDTPRTLLDNPVVLGLLFAVSVLFLQYGRTFIYFQF